MSMTDTNRPQTAATVTPPYGGADRRWFTPVAYLAILTLSLVARMIRVDFSDNGFPVFDEKHYATQAYQAVLGGGVEDYPGYGLVVHPPMGKWLIGLGEMVFGYTPLGWRIAGVIAGVLVVMAVMVMAHRITNSLTWAIFAGLVMNLEGITLVMSRFAMLDIFLTLFITGIALAMVMDLTADRSGTPWHQRWWLLTAGVFSGLAMAVKISGVYYPAVIGVVLVVSVAFTSRSVRETAKALGMGLVFFLVVPVAVFLASWIPWFSSESSTYRRVAEAGKLHEDLPEWVGNVLPDSVASFVSYQFGVLKFHTTLTTSSGSHHPWESKPWHWLTGGRPMLFWSNSETLSGQSQQMILVGNYAVWLLAIPAALAMVYLLARHRVPAYGVALGGLLAGYVPWLIGNDRQMYLFYAAPVAPFLVLCLAIIGWHIAKTAGEKLPSVGTERSSRILAVVSIVIFTGVFVAYTPWFYGVTAPYEYSESLRMFDFWHVAPKPEVAPTS